MKFKVSQKEIKESYSTIYSIGYCHAQRLLRYIEPIAYSCGTYGWSCDYYQIGDTLISTGYRTIGKHIAYDTVKKYEELATNATVSECAELINKMIMGVE